MRIFGNPALLRAMVVLFCAVFAFLMGLLSIRFLKRQIADESDLTEETPKSLDALPMHLYNTVIQQLKQQKQEVLLQSQAEQQRAKLSEILNQAVLSNVSSGVLVFAPNGLVKTFNAAARTILGFASMNGMSAEDVFRGAVVLKDRKDARESADEPVAVSDELHLVLREDSPRRDCRASYQTPAGDQRFIAVTASPVKGSDGSLIGVACIINNLSEAEKIRQQQLLQAQTSSEMALHLRSSLRAISDYAEQLAAAKDQDSAAQLAKDIAEQAAELDRTLGGFLTSADSDTAAAGAAAGS